MQLSGRLQKIAAFIPPGDRIIDVGTDHAYIPIWLLLQDPAATAIATDIRPGPLERARADAAYYGVADQLKLPVKYIGVGEQADDLIRFNGREFVEALFE